MKIFVKILLILLTILLLSLICPFFFLNKIEIQEKKFDYVLFDEKLIIEPKFQNRSLIILPETSYFLLPFSNFSIPIDFDMNVSNFIFKLKAYEIHDQPFSLMVFDREGHTIFSKESSEFDIEISFKNKESFPLLIQLNSASNQTWVRLKSEIVWSECMYCYLVSDEIFLRKGNFTMSKIKIEIDKEVNASIYKEKPLVFFKPSLEKPSFSFSKEFEIENVNFDSFFLLFFSENKTQFNVKVTQQTIQTLPVIKYINYIKLCSIIAIISLIAIALLTSINIFLKLKEKIVFQKLKKKWSL